MEAKPTSDRHVPVLLQRCVNLLAPGIEAARQSGTTPVIIDATLGMGGHSEAILNQFDDVLLIGLDRDTQALELASKRLASFGDRFKPVHTTYDRIDEALAEAGAQTLSGILFDLGVSSLQLDERDRGFAYSYDAPLDMRMNQSAGIDAAELLNTVEERELIQIIRVYGEERFANRIAAAIIKRREETPFTRTKELSDVIIAAVPPHTKGGHPAKRTFQAIRIAVNEELAILEDAIPNALDRLHVGGRLVAMSYHSLEDQIVKRHLRERSKSKAPVGLPIEPEELKATFTMVTKGTEAPSAEEIAENSRAASAKLRAAERIREDIKPQADYPRSHRL
ncbi:16S rRNA (cytosine(1402)-N(4))-methyltransferase RsmH [Micrococcoides hystricis]|uniref:Ribosomal RNA small subunit methyltransferase H n=1 Tax=Micrococcoides hystricis TaxID=1572761 RepID=A0ABV6P6S2_9MICC